jgi:hypothetical protein
MNTQRPAHVSVIDPIRPAIGAVKTILFKPFSLEKWFAIGFCAWLAYLGQGGGGPNFNFRTSRAQPHFHQAKQFVLENLVWLIPAAVFLFILMIVVTLLILWLSSRGQFMFLHCVVHNKAQVKHPWSKFKQHAASLFVFRLVLALISFFATAILCLPIVFLAIALARGSDAGLKAAPIIGIIIFALLVLVLGAAFGLVLKFTADFVVPVMFMGSVNCLDAWRKFLTILSVNKARFALYIIFQIVMAVAIITIIGLASCLTCCCLGCILALPYIGTVLLLPVFVFKRAYSLLYLRQFGPAFDALVPTAA